MSRGASVPGSPDNLNQERYESWNGSRVLPLEMRINDESVQRGPLFRPEEIRRDTVRLSCPPDLTAGKWQAGELEWPTLQFDYVTQTYVFDFPRIEAPTRYFFQREFVEGHAKWVARAPLVTNEVRLGFQASLELDQPGDGWFRLRGPFRKGQKEVVLTRKLPLGVKLIAGLDPQSLVAQWTLVLKYRAAPPQ